MVGVGGHRGHQPAQLQPGSCSAHLRPGLLPTGGSVLSAMLLLCALLLAGLPLVTCKCECPPCQGPGSWEDWGAVPTPLPAGSPSSKPRRVRGEALVWSWALEACGAASRETWGYWPVRGPRPQSRALWPPWGVPWACLWEQVQLPVDLATAQGAGPAQPRSHPRGELCTPRPQGRRGLGVGGRAVLVQERPSLLSHLQPEMLRVFGHQHLPVSAG